MGANPILLFALALTNASALSIPSNANVSVHELVSKMPLVLRCACAACPDAPSTAGPLLLCVVAHMCGCCRPMVASSTWPLSWFSHPLQFSAQVCHAIAVHPPASLAHVFAARHAAQPSQHSVRASLQCIGICLLTPVARDHSCRSVHSRIEYI